MNLPDLPRNGSRREMRKALIRMRLELHRQELRHETQVLTRPLRQVRSLATELPQSLGLKHAPLWGIAGVTAVSFLLARGGGASHWLNVGMRLLPALLKNLRAGKT